MRAPARAAGLAALLALAACQRIDAPPALDAPLRDQLLALAVAAPAERAAAVARWRLDRATWERVIVEPYRAAYADYAASFDAAAPVLVTRLARAGDRARIATRAHVAGDPRLTLGQARARWALPVQFPSEVADVDGAPLDVVFVRAAAGEGGGWRALVGIDALIMARLGALAPGCERHLQRVHAGACGDVAWMVADAALRSDLPRLARACGLAANACGAAR